MFEIIPAIDLLDGAVVRLKQGDYNRAEKYHRSAEDIAKEYEDKGAERIHIVDLNGAKAGKLVNAATIEKIRKATSITIECGGGIRSKNTIDQLFSLGINYVVLGSVLIHDFKFAIDMTSLYPKQIIAGIDVKKNCVAVLGWTQTSSFDAGSLIKKVGDYAFESIIFTDIEKDGMLTGPNISLLLEMAAISKLPIIASGGVGDLSDIEALKKCYTQGISGCVVGKAILSQNIELESLFTKKV